MQKRLDKKNCFSVFFIFYIKITVLGFLIFIFLYSLDLDLQAFKESKLNKLDSSTLFCETEDPQKNEKINGSSSSNKEATPKKKFKWMLFDVAATITIFSIFGANPILGFAFGVTLSVLQEDFVDTWLFPPKDK